MSLTVLAAGAAAPACAQGRLDASYTVTLAGVTIGRGSWQIDISDNQYTVAATGMTTGMLRVISTGKGSGASRGAVLRGQLLPATYASRIVADRRTDEVRMSLAGGNVMEFVAEPRFRFNPERVPVTDAHRRGVLDPMTASLVQVPGTGNPLSPDACQTASAIFDGRMRYDLQLRFKRMDQVTSGKGYRGPVAVCSLYFSPVAGYIPNRTAVRYLTRLRDMEVWLAPVAGTRVLAPYRISVPTPLGLGVLEATQYVTAPQNGRAAATSQ